MKVTRTSLLTNKEHTMDLNINEIQMMLWQNGALIQDAFPQLSAGEREFLMSGITPEEWDAHFKDEDECVEDEKREGYD